MALPFLDLDDLAVLHLDHSIGELGDSVIVGDDDDAALVVQNVPLHELDDLPSRVAVERSRRFIQHQDVGLADDGSGDGDTLLLAAAQLLRRQTRALGEPDLLEGLQRLLDGLVPLAPLENQRYRDVLDRRESWEQVEVLKDEADGVEAHVGQLVCRTGSKCPDP